MWSAEVWTPPPVFTGVLGFLPCSARPTFDLGLQREVSQRLKHSNQRLPQYSDHFFSCFKSQQPVYPMTQTTESTQVCVLSLRWCPIDKWVECKSSRFLSKALSRTGLNYWVHFILHDSHVTYLLLKRWTCQLQVNIVTQETKASRRATHDPGAHSSKGRNDEEQPYQGKKTVSLSLALSHSCNSGSRREAAAQATNKRYTAEWGAVF